ncbi:hypothetical protein AB1L88_22240 [Tautonia sp. JC769]|uniref:hypothetical protein n=1 Tax=Tautonia sp. JC769 TaxID=3232135 RepID=UPI00345757B9
MPLFPDVPRDSRAPAAHFADSFSFLTTSAQPFAANVRDLLEVWFSRYPMSESAELRRKFEIEFDVAFFELMLHEVLIQLGHRVTVHPKLHTTTSKPDFAATAACGVCFVEARVSSDKSAAELGRDRALAVFYDAVNQLSLNDYFLDLVSVEIPSGRPPSARRFRRFVQEQVAQLDYEAVLNVFAVNDYEALPRFTYKEGPAFVEFTLIPVKLEARGRVGKRAIGMFPAKTRWGSSSGAIRKALTRKGSKYGQLADPFIIAVNSMSEWGTCRNDFVDALFGSENVTVNIVTGEGTASRERNGFWLGPTGPQHRRVSAALFSTLNPYNLGVAGLTLWLNPWASLPYTGPLIELPHAVVVDEVVTFKSGVALRELLRLPEHWPGDCCFD